MTIGLLATPVFFTVEVLLQALMSNVDTAKVRGRAIKERVRDDTIDIMIEVS